MISPHTEKQGAYSLLDTCSLANETGSQLSVLRKVTFRNTKDGKPFIRVSLEDIHGYIAIGRMFDIDNIEVVGRAFTGMIGKLVLVEYTSDYYNGSVYLSLSSIQAVKQDIAEEYMPFFVGKYVLADVKLQSCNKRINALDMSDSLRAFQQAYCNLDFLTAVSDESISKGLRGYVLNILDQILGISEDIGSDALVAFLYTVITWQRTRQDADTSWDDSNMMFIASMMDRRIETKSCGLGVLSDKLSELAALFTNSAHVISADTYRLFNLYRILSESSVVSVLESRLPIEGFCSYKNYTVRRS